MDYRIYRLSGQQKAKCLLGAAMLSGVISWLFYDSFWVMLSLPGWYLFLAKLYRDSERRKRQEQLLAEFLDMIRSLSAALVAGYSIENALQEAEGDMRLLHGKDSDICRELQTMLQGISVNMPVEKLLREFAGRSGCAEIQEFAEVFSYARKSSGNIGRILESTALRITGRYETRREIAVATASRRMEQKVMNVIPLGILLYLRLSDPSYLQVLYRNVFGVFFMTICLGVYAAALLLSQKLADIDV